MRQVKLRQHKIINQEGKVVLRSAGDQEITAGGQGRTDRDKRNRSPGQTQPDRRDLRTGRFVEH